MMHLILTSFMPLVAISADDARLESKSTFVSKEARAELVAVGESTERVLCFDRSRGIDIRASSVCLTESEWKKTIAIAKVNGRAKHPNDVLLGSDGGMNLGSAGLASSPSTFAGNR